MKKTNPCNILIRQMNISVGARRILGILGVETIEDLHLMHILNAIPIVGTCVTQYPHIQEEFIYTEKIHEEVKSILEELYEATE